MSDEILRRSFSASLRVDTRPKSKYDDDKRGKDDDKMERIVEGRGVPFNEWTVLDTWGDVEWRERFVPDSDGISFFRDDLLMQIAHNVDRPIARMSTGSLEYARAEDGLYVTAMLPDGMPDADNAYYGVKGGIYTDMSIGFQLDGPDASDLTEVRNPEGSLIAVEETVRRFILHEVSIVPHGAYPTTNVEARSIELARSRLKAYISDNDRSDPVRGIRPQTSAKIRRGQLRTRPDRR